MHSAPSRMIGHCVRLRPYGRLESCLSDTLTQSASRGLHARPQAASGVKTKFAYRVPEALVPSVSAPYWAAMARSAATLRSAACKFKG